MSEPAPERNPDLELQEDQPAQRRTWLVQRLGWVVMGAVVLGGLSGVLGKSPLVVVRPAAVYFFLLLVFRLAGRRTLAQLSNFDLILLLIVGDATGNVLMGGDESMLSLALVVLTLVGLTVLMASLESRWPAVGRVVNGQPLVLVRQGELLTEQLRRSRVTREDILQAARQQQGLGSLKEIRYAILEVGGNISIIPWPVTLAAGSSGNPLQHAAKESVGSAT